MASRMPDSLPAIDRLPDPQKLARLARKSAFKSRWSVGVPSGFPSLSMHCRSSPQIGAKTSLVLHTIKPPRPGGPRVHAVRQGRMGSEDSAHAFHGDPPRQWAHARRLHARQPGRRFRAPGSRFGNCRMMIFPAGHRQRLRSPAASKRERRGDRPPCRCKPGKTDGGHAEPGPLSGHTRTIGHRHPPLPDPGHERPSTRWPVAPVRLKVQTVTF